MWKVAADETNWKRVGLSLAISEAKYTKSYTLKSGLTAHAGDFGCIPLAVGTAAYGGAVSLDVALFTVISDQRVDLVARLHGSKHSSVLHYRRLAARHCRVENRRKHICDAKNT